MRILEWLLPRTLQGRVFSLYAVALFSFVGIGEALFYRYQFTFAIEDQQQVAEMMMNVIAPSIGDSAVIGDYDTITKTLDRAIAGSRFSQALFIDTVGGRLVAQNPMQVDWVPPAWLRNWVRAQLFDVNLNIEVGGKDYGVLRLTFADEQVASQLWRVAVMSAFICILGLLAGVVLIRIPLRRWLGNFDRVRAQEAEILTGAVDINQLLDRDAPVEIRHTFDILSRAAGRLSAQREEAAVTLNAITDGVITTDAAYHLLYCNPAAQPMLGISGSESVGMDVRSLFPALFFERDGGTDWKVRQIEATAPNGGRMILDTTLSTIYSNGNQVAGFVVACRDMTQQHALDQQLRNELQMRQRALDSMHRVLSSLSDGVAAPPEVEELDVLIQRVVALMDERERSRRALDNQKFALDQHAIVSITDLQGVITYANDRMCEISEYSRPELLGANHRIVSSGTHSQAFFGTLWSTISNGKVWRGEICNRTKSGTFYWVDATIVPLMGADGLPEQYIAIRTDITARKNFEARLADQLQFVEVLLEATPTAIYLQDTEGRYVRFNKAFEDLYGISRHDWIGKTVFDLVPDEAPLMNAHDAEVLQGTVVQTYQGSFNSRRNGERRDALYWKAPLQDAQGRRTGLVGTILDITEKNRFEQELREAKRFAEAANEAKGNFLANMSHEIRTPMNGVIGMTDLALDTALDPQQREYLNIVKSSAQSLLVILNDILDFSKIEAGKLHIEAVEFSIQALFGDALKTLQARAQGKALALKCTLPNDLPDRVLGDPVRIRQVLTNLCDNAIKFTAQGAVSVQVDWRSVGEDAQAMELHIAVQDTGIGIPLDKQQRVFEAFSQADTSTTRKFGGTGLGLTICARLVELMGGRIWLESVPDVGSTFHFTVRLAMPPENKARIDKALVAGEKLPTRPLTILLVEDHPINQMLATTLLTKWGHQVVLAKNGQEAVDLFPSQRWDLVLMDMQMPVLGGVEATRQIRASETPAGRRTPIVAMTANAMEVDRQACLAAGMDDHLAKPFQGASLQAVLARYAPA